MGLENKLGKCLPSQQIREWIKSGKIIVPSFDEERIQPSSFEPIISDELFILDTETNYLLRPKVTEEVYRTLIQLPGRQRHRVNINKGLELKKGFSYLIPLEEKVKINLGEYIKSSPKSSSGRLFLNTRMLADYNPCIDEVNPQYKSNSELNLWLLVQSLAFNLIVNPGLSLNQLRFFKGYNAKLTPSELIKELKKNPLLYIKSNGGSLVPAEPFVTDDLEIHLDLSGKNTEGILGLRARHNPTPIDLSKEREYEAEEFFEPLKGNKKIRIKEGEYYLFASSEVLKIPPHLNVELKSHSHIGFSGQLHFAGFIDNGFEGDLVFEVRSDELANIELEDGMPISKLDVFRTGKADKTYGPSIGSNYNGQVGPNPSKHFKWFDFGFAAKNYKKLDRLVLVQDAKILNSHRKKKEGFELLSTNQVSKLYCDIENGFFQSRYDCEFDPLILQPIPYVLLFGDNENIFSYIRAKNIKDYGDERLFGKHSIGLGGHIIKSDAPDYIEKNIEREVLEEEVEVQGNLSKPKLVGTLMAYDKPVDRVHFGLISVIHTNGYAKPKESSIISGSMIPIKKLMNDSNYPKKYETWSKVLIPHLFRIYKL